MQSSSSLRAKVAIVTASVAIVILVWGFVVTQIRHERHEAIAAGTRENVNRVIAVEQYVTRTLEGADLATAYLADRYANLLEGTPATPVVHIVPISDFALRSPAVREINIFNAKGNLVATSVEGVPANVNVFSTAIFQQHRSRESTALRVNPPSRSRFLHSWFVLLSRRVNQSDGSFGGTVSVQIRPEELTNILQNASLSETDVVSVIGLDGITRARRTGDSQSFGEDLSGKPVMHVQAKNPNGSYLGAGSLDGVIRYFSLRSLPQYDIFVGSGMSEAVMLRPVQSRARGYVTAAVLISVVTLLAAWLMLALVRRREARESEVVAANARLRKAQQLARLGDWSFDPAHETFVWSADLCIMYERPAAERRVSLSAFGDLVGQHGIETFRFALKQMQSSGEQQEYELAARLPSGTVSHRRIVAVPDLDASGRLVGVHGTDQDITPRKLLESLQEQVSHLSRIDGLNAIAATLAHELTQPLAAASNYLSGSVRMLSGPASLDQAVLAEALGEVRAQILLAGEIIRRVRNLVNSRQARVEIIAVEPVIDRAVALAEAARPGSRVTVTTQPAAENAPVRADPVQLQQVLVNLIRNARASCRPREPEITIQISCAGTRLIAVSVIDNGHGIMNDGKDIFSPFTTSPGENLGLGLAICKTLIESMGGEIWVAETGPAGTSICFSLPRAETEDEGTTKPA